MVTEQISAEYHMIASCMFGFVSQSLNSLDEYITNCIDIDKLVTLDLDQVNLISDYSIL